MLCIVLIFDFISLQINNKLCKQEYIYQLNIPKSHELFFRKLKNTYSQVLYTLRHAEHAYIHTNQRQEEQELKKIEIGIQQIVIVIKQRRGITWARVMHIRNACKKMLSGLHYHICTDILYSSRSSSVIMSKPDRDNIDTLRLTLTISYSKIYPVLYYYY